jgi:ribose-phosphate pyrophosphokinase
MEIINKKKLLLYSGRSHPELAVEIARDIGVELGNPNISDFPSGETHGQFGESVRGADVFIMQTHYRPVNDSIMEQLILIDAAKRASAKRITAVCPYLGYSRQDRKASGREPITAKLVTDLFKTAGADRLISVDLHSGQIQGFFDGPVDHLTALPVLLDYLRAESDNDIVVVAPDAGRVKVAERFSQHLHSSLAFVHKLRPKVGPNSVVAMDVVGDVEGRRCVIIDDMIDTAGTICAAAEALYENGAAEVVIVSTHAVFSGPAIDRLKNSRVSQVIVTDTLPLAEERRFDKLTVLSVAPIVARAISEVFEDGSVTSMFEGDE